MLELFFKKQLVYMLSIKVLLGLLVSALCVLAGNERGGEAYMYDLQVHFMLDETFVEGEDFLIPMETWRDTSEYREAAYEWFMQQYELALPGGTGFGDLIFDNKTVFLNWRINPFYRMNVVGVDVQNTSSWRGRYPVGNAQMLDDGYIVQVIAPGFVVHGTFAEEMGFGEAGYEVPIGSFILFGEYRMVTDDGETQITFPYASDCPVTPSPYPPFTTPINCKIRHPELGVGLNDGQTRLASDAVRSVYRITIPELISDATNLDQRHSSNLPPYRG